MLTQARLKQVLRYNKQTGLFHWRVALSYNRKKGTRAGTFDKEGYVVICINKRKYKAHRLAWLYVYGVWPFI